VNFKKLQSATPNTPEVYCLLREQFHVNHTLLPGPRLLPSCGSAFPCGLRVLCGVISIQLRDGREREKEEDSVGEFHGCCWVHDHCYGRLEEKGCHIRTQSYKYRFARGLVTCELGPLCQVQLCACDRKLVYCLKRNLRSYNPRYRYFPNILCF
uniref:Phospholipase A2 n=1 Tax=Felis catus TaxID=9685 RepID=A0ABI7ZGD6_FELCA